MIIKYFSQEHVSSVELVFFTNALAMMFRSGVPIDEALRILIDQAKGSFRRVLEDVAESIRSGNQLSQAFGKHSRVFPELFVNLIKAGEASGTIDENLERLSIQMKKDYEARRKVVTAMAYPMLILITAVVLSLTLSLFVLPRLIPLFTSLGIDLPFLTKVLLFVANLFVQYGIFIVIVFLVIVFGVLSISRLPKVQMVLHPLFVRIPLAGRVFQAINIARFSRSLHTLLKSGITIDESLRIAGSVLRNRAYRADVQNILHTIEGGATLGTALGRVPEVRWPKIATRMIQVGEETGRFEEALYYIADFYDGDLDEVIKRITTFIEPVLIIFIGIFVGGIALAIITPIYKLTSGLH